MSLTTGPLRWRSYLGLELEQSPLNGLADVRRRVANLSLTEPTALLVQRGPERLELWAQAQSFPLEELPVVRVELDEVPCGDHRHLILSHEPLALNRVSTLK